MIKDAGDDPDVTHHAVIGARVRFANGGGGHKIIIRGGLGVGRVTKPGLEIPPGEPAINPGPRKMIDQSIREVLKAFAAEKSVEVEVFVPEGEHLARKTLNPRLGILGGISILGTTGIVKPMSHAAYVATIKSSISVARACGLKEVVMTTGRRSERYAQGLFSDLPEEAFVQIGDYFQKSLKLARETGIERVRLAVFFGKALKMAQGIPHTHASKSQLTMEALARWAEDYSGDKELAAAVAACNTARQAFFLLIGEHSALIQMVGRRMLASAAAFAGGQLQFHGIIFDFDGKVVYDETH